MEKRTYPRKDFKQDATMILDNRNIVCGVQNISSAGALIRVDKNQIIDLKKFEIGIDIEIIFIPDVSAIKGKILRIVHDGDFIFLAVCFLEHYQFE
jgi:hypothetical protein